MGKEILENISKCIEYLKKYGYEVYKVDTDNLGKWVAFEWEGMDEILHGKIIKSFNTYYLVKCKNGSKRVVGFDNIISFFDNKKECYSFK